MLDGRLHARLDQDKLERLLSKLSAEKNADQVQQKKVKHHELPHLYSR